MFVRADMILMLDGFLKPNIISEITKENSTKLAKMA